MIFRTFQILALIFLITLSLTSSAQDKINWTGPYVAFDAGYTVGHDKNFEPPFGSQPAWSGETKPKGGLIGVSAGYDDLLSDKWLVGLGTEFKTYSADDTAQQYKSTDSTVLCCTIKSSIKNKFSLLARAGYLVDDKTLLYVNGGWAGAQIKRNYMDTEFNYVDSYKNWQDGWTIGLGSELNIYQHITAKIEYRYTDLGSKKISHVFDGNWGEQHQDVYQNELTAGIAYRF